MVKFLFFPGLLALALVAMSATAMADSALRTEQSCVQGGGASGGGGSGVDADPYVGLAGEDKTVSVYYETPVMSGYQYVRVSC